MQRDIEGWENKTKKRGRNWQKNGGRKMGQNGRHYLFSATSSSLIMGILAVLGFGQVAGELEQGRGGDKFLEGGWTIHLQS